MPSCGVGTGYRRDALEKLARASTNRIFEPEALTEDYVNGLRLFRLGCTQTFVPLVRGASSPDWWLRARCFRRTGSRAAPAHALGDRDRASGLAAIRMERKTRRDVLAVAGPQGIARKSAQPAGESVFYLRRRDLPVDSRSTPPAPGSASRRWRFRCCGRWSEWLRRARLWRGVLAGRADSRGLRQCLKFGRDVPGAGTLRHPACAGPSAQMAQDRTRLSNRAALLAHKRKLGEILVGAGHLTPAMLAAALEAASAIDAPGRTSGEQRPTLSENLYEGLSLQQGLPIARLDARRCRQESRARCRKRSSAIGRFCLSGWLRVTCSWPARRFPRLKPTAPCASSLHWNFAFIW